MRRVIPALCLLSLASCTFLFPLGTTQPVETPPEELPFVARPLDVVVIVDNSGSMCEEQLSLLRGIFDPDACPIDDLTQVPEQYQYTYSTQSSQALEEDVLPVCGLAQVLAAYHVDTRIGLITTDVSECDNALQQANLDQFLPFNCYGELFPERGRVPQRGCLQAAPGSERKFVSTTDPDFAQKLTENMQSIGTWGSGFERGFDAMQAFLDPNSDRAPGCRDDLATFLRPDARLLVIFVSDEDDCSHGDEFPNENVNITCDEDAQETFAGSARDCYDEPGALAPVEPYVDFLRTQKRNPGDVYALVIAGLVGNGADALPVACSLDGDEPTEDCTPSFGASNIPSTCFDNNCCEADAANRYARFASAFGADTDIICQPSVSDAIVRAAKVIGESR